MLIELLINQLSNVNFMSPLIRLENIPASNFVKHFYRTVISEDLAHAQIIFHI
jgi:hypothetical protein